MKHIIRHAGLLASAALVLTAGGSAMAGEPGKKAGEPVVVSGNDVGRPMPMRKHWDPAARADHLRIILQLRPDQEPALKAFLDATKPTGRGIDVRGDKAGKGPEARPEASRPLTTPERLDLEAKRMADHQAAFQKRAAATRAFYGQLSPSQRKVFDTLHHGGGGRHIKIIRRGGPKGPMMGGPMMGGPEGGPPPPGGMAWMDEDGMDLAMLDDDDIDVRVIIDDEEIGGDDD